MAAITVVIDRAFDPDCLVVFSVVLVFRQRDLDSGPDELGDDGRWHSICREFPRLSHPALYPQHWFYSGGIGHRSLYRCELGDLAHLGSGFPVHAFQDRVGWPDGGGDLRDDLHAGF